MRTLALLLILVNVCFLFWTQYIDVQPNSSASSAPASPSPRLMLARESANAQPTAASQLSCISIGPFAQNNDATQVQQRLEQAGYTIAPRTEQGEVFSGYWVSLPGFTKRAEADQALQRLRAGGITDAYLLAEETPPMISLGLFNEQTHAERRRDDAAKLGFEPQIQTRTRVGDIYWLDVGLKEPGQLIDPALLQQEQSGIVRLETRPCPTASASSSAATHPG